MISLLHLTSTSDMGGAERMVLQIAQGLADSRYKVFVASTTGGGELLRLVRPFVSEVRLFSPAFPGDPVTIAALARFIRRHRIDIVQTHGLRADILGRPAARLGGAGAVVSTIHSIDPWRRSRHTWADRMTAPLVNKFMAVCKAARDASMQREGYSRDRIEVIPIGISPQVATEKERGELLQNLPQIEGRFPVISVTANLREMKGHRDIIDAAPDIIAAFPQALFVFAGRDDSNGAIGQYARERGVDSHILFPGFIEIPALFQVTDIVLLASHWEGLPVSIIEAMHAALPIVATEVGGIPELIRDGEEGILIAPKQPGAISEAVKHLASDESLRGRFGERAQSRAKEEFSLDTMLARMDALYCSLLS